MTDHALLGPQYRSPNLKGCLERLRLDGPLAVVTAGWQEREGEIEELRAHAGQPVVDLGLYARAEAVSAEDPALAAATRARQEELQELQDLYRLRLGALMGAVTELAAGPDGSPARRRARRAALGDVRRLDRAHLAATTGVHDAFERQLRPQGRPSVAPHVAALRESIEAAAAVLVAGGHVAVLANRLRLFGLGRLLAGKPLIAWSAGAMALSERIVLFHDRPPQGAAHAEVLEGGLGLVPGVVALPHAHVRLALDDPQHLGNFARRFAPASCLMLEHGSLARWHRGRLVEARNLRRITRTGRLAEVEK